ncbi:hypothetical protein BS78_K066500 [Paspalum vaginatum]|uniref:Uncharacterized protein n=1 Tax=Paspalum vaginatum TaxID=158149 RepID=A0A9W7X986_9POAL|nr:hypothetical protein BS78_K066500 [Paspalum vaginatum]
MNYGRETLVAFDEKQIAGCVKYVMFSLKVGNSGNQGRQSLCLGDKALGIMCRQYFEAHNAKPVVELTTDGLAAHVKDSFMLLELGVANADQVVEVLHNESDGDEVYEFLGLANTNFYARHLNQEPTILLLTYHAPHIGPELNKGEERFIIGQLLTWSGTCHMLKIYISSRRLHSIGTGISSRYLNNLSYFNLRESEQELDIQMKKMLFCRTMGPRYSHAQFGLHETSSGSKCSFILP